MFACHSPAAAPVSAGDGRRAMHRGAAGGRRSADWQGQPTRGRRGHDRPQHCARDHAQPLQRRLLHRRLILRRGRRRVGRPLRVLAW